MKVDGGEGENTKCLSNIRDDLFRDAFSFLQLEGVSLSHWASCTSVFVCTKQ